MKPQLKKANDKPLPVPLDRGGNGWKTKVSLCESIVKAVTYKSGTTLYAETVDDVIQELEKRGHLHFEQNVYVDTRRAGTPNQTGS